MVFLHKNIINCFFKSVSYEFEIMAIQREVLGCIAEIILLPIVSQENDFDTRKRDVQDFSYLSDKENVW